MPPLVGMARTNGTRIRKSSVVVRGCRWRAEAVMGPERIALKFSWTVTGRREEGSATIDYINGELKHLHP